MNETIQNMLERRSIRQYKADPIPADVLDTIIKAGIYAPSGRNIQTPVIVAVENKEEIAALSKANAAVMGSTNDPFYGAPVVLAVLAAKNAGTYVYDGSLVMGNLMLAAHACGVGSCWIHRAKEVFSQPEWQEWLKKHGVEEEVEGIGFCILGYADCDLPEAAPRRENRVFYVK